MEGAFGGRVVSELDACLEPAGWFEADAESGSASVSVSRDGFDELLGRRLSLAGGLRERGAGESRQDGLLDRAAGGQVHPDSLRWHGQVRRRQASQSLAGRVPSWMFLKARVAPIEPLRKPVSAGGSVVAKRSLSCGRWWTKARRSSASWVTRWTTRSRPPRPWQRPRW